jgi:hypothetical protein
MTRPSVRDGGHTAGRTGNLPPRLSVINALALFLNRCMQVIRVELQPIPAYMSCTSWSAYQVHLDPGTETDFRVFIYFTKTNCHVSPTLHSFSSFLSFCILFLPFLLILHSLSSFSSYNLYQVFFLPFISLEPYFQVLKVAGLQMYKYYKQISYK